MKTYALALEGDFSLKYLQLPLMTLAQAEQAQRKLKNMGKDVLIVNVRSE